MTGGHTLIARLDNAGDVLLSGPAVRAAAAHADRVTFLAGPAGTAAARLLPGVDEVGTWRAPWVGFEPHPVDRGEIDDIVDWLTGLRIDRAAVLTSFHQSPLPMALLLRMAGVGCIAAVSRDYPGTLLDHRCAEDPALHEVEQNLAVVAALGCPLPDGDDRKLHLVGLPSNPMGRCWPTRRRSDGSEGSDGSDEDTPSGVGGPYVVLHPGASVPSRAIPPGVVASTAELLLADGWDVVVSGAAGERPAGLPAGVHDVCGRTDLANLAALLADADVVICGNTGPAHLAAAVGTPVVSVFAPVVDWRRWHPWGVPTVRLGDQDIACARCRARVCPLDTQRCLAPVTAPAIVEAVRQLRQLAGGGPRPAAPAVAGRP